MSTTSLLRSSSANSQVQIPMPQDLSATNSQTSANNNNSDESSLEKQVFEYAVNNDWEGAESIYHQHSHMIRIRLTMYGETALHVAARANSIDFVRGLVNLISPQDLEITNTDGNNAFCVAAISGSDCEILNAMIQKNDSLPLTAGHDNMLPVHLAALNGRHQIVKYLSTPALLKEMDEDAIRRLFFITIASRIYDVATDLFKEYPDRLVTARDANKGNLTALHMLARIKPSLKTNMREDDNKEAAIGLRLLKVSLFVLMGIEQGNEEASEGWGSELELLKIMWNHVKQLRNQNIMELEPSEVMIDAIKYGNDEVVKLLVSMSPEVLTQKDSDGKTLLHYAAFYGEKKIFDFLLDRVGKTNPIVAEVDNDGNTVLHCAALQSKVVPSSSNLSPNSQMQRELQRFEDVKWRVPRRLRRMRNHKGETAKEVFDVSHKKLSEETQEKAKGIVESSLVVATLIISVAFAASTTVPGGDKSKPWFVAFILANAIALFAAAASIVSLLSIFIMPWFVDNESIISVQTRLRMGIGGLGYSVFAMAVAFVAACFLIFGETRNSKWVPNVVIAVAYAPVLAILGITRLGEYQAISPDPSPALFVHVFRKIW